jgi:folate-binding Fe-S cluster repair protein YgfZ
VTRLLQGEKKHMTSKVYILFLLFLWQMKEEFLTDIEGTVQGLFVENISEFSLFFQ